MELDHTEKIKMCTGQKLNFRGRSTVLNDIDNLYFGRAKRGLAAMQGTPYNLSVSEFLAVVDEARQHSRTPTAFTLR